MRIGLGLGLGRSNRGRGFPLCDAIAQKVYVTAKEGNKAVKLAPHVVYTRNGEQWVAGVDAADNHPKLATMKVSKLAEIALTSEAFAPDPGFDPADAQFGNEIICRIEL